MGADPDLVAQFARDGHAFWRTQWEAATRDGDDNAAQNARLRMAEYNKLLSDIGAQDNQSTRLFV